MTIKKTKELQIALKAAKDAAALILKYHLKRSFKVRHKGEINLVTEVDELAQKLIVKTIKKAFPKDSILAEEGDLSSTKSSPRRWIVDPLDGTTNFAHGYPCFCVSIAFEENGKIECGVIHDPTRKEIFYAVRGKGAYLNGKKIKVSSQTELRKSLLVTGFPYELDDPSLDNVPLFVHMLRKAQAVRRDGSAALNLAYVASGRFDAFWEIGLSPWDIAAGALLVEEAGGSLSNFEGGNYSVYRRDLVCGNPTVFSQLQKEVIDVWSNQRKTA